jgi:hypothetical protein
MIPSQTQAADHCCLLHSAQLILNATDPTEQLAWLTGVLAKAKASNEIVFIIGHIPFSTQISSLHPVLKAQRSVNHTSLLLCADDVGCLYKYSSQYERLIRQYAPIIKTQLFGHTHDDSVCT